MGAGAGRCAEGGAEELEEVAVLDWREEEPRDVPVLAIIGIVSRTRALLDPPPDPLPEEGSCLGRRQRQQHTATTEPTNTNATKTEPTMRKGT